MTIPTDRRPIGFWLELVDRLIDECLEKTLGDLTRRHWQVLKVVQQGAVDQSELPTVLAVRVGSLVHAPWPLGRCPPGGWRAANVGVGALGTVCHQHNGQRRAQ
jgi:hypothetical protein